MSKSESGREGGGDSSFGKFLGVENFSKIDFLKIDAECIHGVFTHPAAPKMNFKTPPRLFSDVFVSETGLLKFDRR